MIRVKDVLLLLCVFATPFIQLSQNISGELSLSTYIGEFNIFYTEFIALIAIFCQLFFLKKIAHKKILGLILLGLFISFISCFVNEHDDWFLRFCIGADFYIYGLLFAIIDFNWNQLRVIRVFLLLLFYFVCFQIILIATGILNLEKGTEMGVLVRFGSTAGSSIQSAFLIYILMAILALLFKKRFILISICVLGVLAIAFSLSRGPILSLMFAFGLYVIFYFKKYRKKIIFFVLIIGCFLFVLEERYGFLSIMEERNASEDVTSGRDERWIKTADIYSQSSFLFGAGNAITPSERLSKSEMTIDPNISSSPHNVYLSFLVENGILGMLNFIVLIIVLVRILIKKKIKPSYSFFVFLSLPLIMMNAEIILRNGVVAFFFWLLFYLLQYTTKNSKLL